jgi:hypothetical protein
MKGSGGILRGSKTVRLLKKSVRHCRISKITSLNVNSHQQRKPTYQCWRQEPKFLQKIMRTKQACYSYGLMRTLVDALERPGSSLIKDGEELIVLEIIWWKKHGLINHSQAVERETSNSTFASVCCYVALNAKPNMPRLPLKNKSISRFIHQLPQTLVPS